MRVIGVSMEQHRYGGAGETGDPREPNRRPTASSDTIPTCGNPVTRPGIEPGSPWWEASRLIAQPPRPPSCVRPPAAILSATLDVGDLDPGDF
ncbi:hypothetical protein PR048_030545 [Dryococelus australis]|uniref:Uncharacterized protein n=1 Tax=Dryococelus australis TaxID=614101 RepID=A0ABQ9G993_9NEOP|nr:hypothetical protein PR048_030545 [Dryococelus australis]